MSKEYAPIKIVNPIVKNHLVRLAPNQKLNLLLSLPEYDEAEINLLSDFLTLESRQDTANTISFVYKQIIPNDFQFLNLFLGELHIISGPIESSLCLLLETNSENSVLSVVNPNGQMCRFDHDQMISISFYQKMISDFSIESGTYTKLCVKSSIFNPGFQQFHFALDDLSMEALGDLPRGRYNSGNILFRGSETYKFGLILNWKEKKKFYKKSILPIMDKKKNAVRCVNVSFKKLDKEIDADCNFVEIGAS